MKSLRSEKKFQNVLKNRIMSNSNYVVMCWEHRNTRWTRERVPFYVRSFIDCIWLNTECCLNTEFDWTPNATLFNWKCYYELLSVNRLVIKNWTFIDKNKSTWTLCTGSCKLAVWFRWMSIFPVFEHKIHHSDQW